MDREELRLHREKLLDARSRLIVEVLNEENHVQGHSASAETDKFLDGYAPCEDLRLVEAALERIERQTYGNCHHCGRRIERKRLEKIPWAHFCEMCQGLGKRTRRCFAH
jgi:RNA polymerase-binding transcription factor DksA